MGPQALGAFLGTLLWLLAAAGSALAQPQAMEPLDHTICRIIESAARAQRLPIEFMTRLIWRESSFRASVVSPAGAQGIAQFMPATAQERGLADPFDPEEAIPKAAHLLADLRRRFGNLGIAAAAYNAGATRVANWLHGGGALPAETRAYVRFVTSRAVEAWNGSGSSAGSDQGEKPAAGAEPAAPKSCLAAVADLRRGRGAAPEIGPDEAPAFAPLAPWGVQLAGNFSKEVALASFERARGRYGEVIGSERPMIIGRVLRSRGTRKFYQVRLPAATRAAAEALCARIQSVGGVCVAMRS
jgi:hypothetical protein